MTRPKILVLTLTRLASDARVLRQAQKLSEHFDVTTAGHGPNPGIGLPHIELPTGSINTKPLWYRARFYGGQLTRLHRQTLKLHPFQSEARKALQGTSWDLVFSNDVIAAPLAAGLDSKHGYVCDLHEYAPRQGEHNWKWRLVVAPLMRWILRNFIAGKAAGVTTVGKGIADEYAKQFGIVSSLVINATPEAKDLQPQPISNPIKLVHSGVPGPARKLEVMIEAVKRTKTDVTFDLYLMQRNFDYLKQLHELAGDCPRIRFQEPVKYDELVPTLAKYDLGLSLIAPSTFNLKWCLPNKFFDFVQARLGIVIGPSPEMQRYVEDYGLGAVARDFTVEALVEVLDSLDPASIMNWKESSHSHSHELSGEKQSENWVTVARHALSAKSLS